MDPDLEFRSNFSGETRARIEHLANLTGRTYRGVVEAALGLWEQALLTSMPPAPQKPQNVERDDAYAPMTEECDGF